jgi:ParB-like chromosome segregation protein Spo0J
MELVDQPTPQFSEDLRELLVDIDSLKPHPDNPRKGDVDGITASLQRFGQVRPVVVRAETREVVAGNHTMEAARRLGWPQIAAVMVDLSEEDARAYLIADNRLADTASYDDESLVRVLEQLSAENGLEGTGFSSEEVDDLVAALDSVETTPPEDFKGDYSEPEDETAARWEGRNEGQRREVVFLLEHDKFDTFRENVNKLKVEYEVESMSEAIYEAVRREAEGQAAPDSA